MSFFRAKRSRMLPQNVRTATEAPTKLAMSICIKKPPDPGSIYAEAVSGSMRRSSSKKLKTIGPRFFLPCVRMLAW